MCFSPHYGVVSPHLTGYALFLGDLEMSEVFFPVLPCQTSLGVIWGKGTVSACDDKRLTLESKKEEQQMMQLNRAGQSDPSPFSCSCTRNKSRRHMAINE
jgi:hypothetical protein